MIDILSTVQLVLREAGYTTRLRTVEDVPVVCFEDDLLVGFCSIFDSAQALLDGWSAREMAILRKFSSNFHSAGEKAWNVYTAFLCADSSDATRARQILWIEENLERTRKNCRLRHRIAR